MSKEVKLTKKDVVNNVSELLTLLEFWQDLLENWPYEAEHVVFESAPTCWYTEESK